MYKDYKELRDKGYSHEETFRYIDKSDRQLYRYLKKYKEEELLEEDNEILNITVNESKNYLDKNLEKFSKNKIVLQSIRNEINTHTTELGRLEVFNELLVDEIKKYLDDHKEEKFKFEPIEIKDDYNLYTVSDTHLGSEVDLENNFYDLDVCNSRFEELTNYIISDIEKLQLKRIGLGFFGDNVEGSNLRISQLWKISQLIPGQTIEVIDIYEKMIRTIADYVEIDIYFILFDNHGRLSLVTSNKDNVSENNMNIVIANMLLRLLKDVDNINWYISDEIDININGLNIFMNHGHEAKLNEAYYKKLFNLRNNMDFYIHGHYHTFRYTSMNDLNIDRAAISLPSMIGADDYSLSIACSSKAASLKISFNQDGVSCIRKITFTE